MSFVAVSRQHLLHRNDVASIQSFTRFVHPNIENLSECRALQHSGKRKIMK
jgi:hypothetical protein